MADSKRLKATFGSSSAVERYLEDPENIYDVVESVKEKVEEVIGSELDYDRYKVWVEKNGNLIETEEPSETLEAEEEGYKTVQDPNSGGYKCSPKRGRVKLKKKSVIENWKEADMEEERGKEHFLNYIHPDFEISITFGMSSYRVEADLEDSSVSEIAEVNEFLTEDLEDKIYDNLE